MSNFGKYKAEVVDVNDPETRGRIRVKCPSILGEQVSEWALPCFLPNTFSIPKRGALVWIEFEEGLLDSPIWCGVFYTKSQWQETFEEAYSSDNFLINVADGDMNTNIRRGNKKTEVKVGDNTTITGGNIHLN